MKTIHLIGNAHLDPVWLWQWQEGFLEVKATFRSALDRMKEFPDFKFTSACSAYYMWVEKSDPEMFREIQERVREGRWSIVGGWFIQPDCNMPSGESFARHALISQRYFKEKFGVIARTGYNVDSFGHNGNLPQILRKSGMDRYVFMRPMPHEKNLPAHLFDWVSMDGSRVKTYRIPFFYNIDPSRPEFFQKVSEIEEDINGMAFYGVGNHGGGATVEMLDWMHRNLDEQYVYSTPDDYFESVKEEKVPVVRDDLQFHSKGCYSTVSEIKRNNRKSENMLYEAEAFSVLSGRLVGTEYPAKDLERAWCNVLFNQFHDIMCGCAIREAYDDARMQHGETQTIAARSQNFALQQISWAIDTMDGKELKAYKIPSPPSASWRTEEIIGTPVVIFNPLAYPVKTVVSVRELPKYMTDDQGKTVLMQKVRDSKTNGTDKYKVAFPVELPAYGYKVYRMYFDKVGEMPESDLSVGENTLENSRLRLTFDPDTAELSSVVDKSTGRELILPGADMALMDEEHCDTWAHDIVSFKKLAKTSKEGSLHVTENGPVRVTMRCESEIGSSRVVRDYSLTPGSEVIAVNTLVDFREKHKMLKFRMPVAAKNPQSVCEIPYGHISRPNDGGEQVSLNWMALKGEEGGLAIATDSRYSFDTEENVLSLTVLRGAIYADHFGQKTRDEFCEFMDQGQNRFTYAIFPFAGTADAARKAQELNCRPTALIETFHHGKLGTEWEGIRISADNLVVTALKKHEDSDSVILRCYEADNRDTDAEITLLGKTFSAHFGHNEIKTFIVSRDGVKETDFLE